MSYLRQPHKAGAKKEWYSPKPAKFVPITHKMTPPHVEIAKHPERYPNAGEGKKLFFPLRKDNLTVPQMTLREIAWTILDSMARDSMDETDYMVNNLFLTQKLTPLERVYVLDLIPRLRDEELRVQMFYAA